MALRRAHAGKREEIPFAQQTEEVTCVVQHDAT